MAYVSVSKADFDAEMDDMKFLPVLVPGCMEFVYQRAHDKVPRYTIRVYSSVDMRAGVTRECGTDAIRTVVFDSVKNRPLKIEKRIHRTGEPLVKVRQRCRELWSHISKNRCTCCADGLMVERKGKNGAFMGCTNYPACKSSAEIAKAA